MSESEALRDRFAAAMMLNYGTPPLALARGEGSRVWDADGNRYLDLIGGSAVSALGHAHPAIVGAVTAQVRPCRSDPFGFGQRGMTVGPLATGQECGHLGELHQVERAEDQPGVRAGWRGHEDGVDAAGERVVERDG